MAGYSGYGGSGGQNGYGGSSGYSIYGESSGQSGYCGPSGQGGYGGSSGHSRYGGSNGQTGYGGPSGPSGINGRSGQNGHNGHNGRSGHSGHNGYNGYGDDDWESHLYGESSRQKEQRQQPQRHRRRPRIVPSRQYEVYYSASDLENKIDSNDEEWNGGYVSLAETHLYENVEYKKRYDAYMNNEEENNDNNETEPIYESLQQGSAYDESYVKSHPVGIQRQEGIDLPDSPAKTSNQPRRILPETGQEIFARPRQMSPTLGNRVLPNTPVNKNTESAPVQNQPTRMNNTYTGNQPSADVAAPPHVQSEVNAVGQTQLMVVQPVVFSTQPGCMTGYLSSVFYLCHNAGCAGSACHRQC